MLGQHCPDAKILDKEIACILSASVWTTGQHHPNVVLGLEGNTFGCSLNLETRGAHYGKPVAQKTVRMLNASVRTPPREIRDKPIFEN
jgi:hypothetical protein